MTLIVTDHAVERFAERIIGIDPATLSRPERDLIADSIRQTVAPRVCRGVQRIHISGLVFAIHHGDTVMTVFKHGHRGNPRTYKGRPSMHRRSA